MVKLFLFLLLIPVSLHAEYNILADVNTFRAEHNLKPIVRDERLCKLATIRAKHIQTDWSHNKFQSELDKIQGMPGRFYENLARNYEPEDVVYAWSISKRGHREAMLRKDTKIGCVVKIKNYYAYEVYSY